MLITRTLLWATAATHGLLLDAVDAMREPKCRGKIPTDLSAWPAASFLRQGDFPWLRYHSVDSLCVGVRGKSSLLRHVMSWNMDCKCSFIPSIGEVFCKGPLAWGPGQSQRLVDFCEANCSCAKDGEDETQPRLEVDESIYEGNWGRKKNYGSWGLMDDVSMKDVEDSEEEKFLEADLYTDERLCLQRECRGYADCDDSKVLPGCDAAICVPNYCRRGHCKNGRCRAEDDLPRISASIMADSANRWGGKRDSLDLACACNSTYVSHGCCSTETPGMLWEAPKLKIGSMD